MRGPQSASVTGGVSSASAFAQETERQRLLRQEAHQESTRPSWERLSTGGPGSRQGLGARNDSIGVMEVTENLRRTALDNDRNSGPPQGSTDSLTVRGKRKEEDRRSTSRKNSGDDASPQPPRTRKTSKLLSDAGDERPPLVEQREAQSSHYSVQPPSSSAPLNDNSSVSSASPTSTRRSIYEPLPILPLQSPRRWLGDESSADEAGRKLPPLPRTRMKRDEDRETAR